jgi:hypothetical protein
MSPLVDRTGHRYGRLTVIARVGRASNRDALWSSRCDCGSEIEVSASNLRAGHTRSCGCLMRETAAAMGAEHGGANLRHGHTRRGRKSAEFQAYTNAKRRCRNPRTQGFEHWGGRGIEFRYASFEEFYGDVGPKPSRDLSLDRIDNDGHYEPGNCRWATRSVQNANQRPRRCRSVIDANLAAYALQDLSPNGVAPAA